MRNKMKTLSGENFAILTNSKGGVLLYTTMYIIPYVMEKSFRFFLIVSNRFLFTECSKGYFSTLTRMIEVFHIINSYKNPRNPYRKNVSHVFFLKQTVRTTLNIYREL